MKAPAKLQQLAVSKGAWLTFEFNPYSERWEVAWERTAQFEDEQLRRSASDLGSACVKMLDDLPFHWSWNE